MKVTVERDALAPALDMAFTCVQRKPVIPILGCFRLSAANGLLRITANDMDSAIEVSIPAEVSRSGDVAVTADTLRSIVRNSQAGAQAVIDADERKATLRIARSRYSLSSMPATDFPAPRAIAEDDRVVEIDMPAADVARMLARPRPFVPDPTKRAELGGLWLHQQDGRLWCFGANGYQLMAARANKAALKDEHADFSFPEEENRTSPGILIPTPTAETLARVLDGGGSIVTNGRTIVAETATIRFAGGLFRNIYPPAWRAVPEIAENRIIVDRDELQAALKRLAAVDAETAYLVVRAEAGDEMLSLSLTETASGAGEESIRIDGAAPGAFHSMFQLPVFAQVVAACVGDKLALSRDAGNPGTRIEDGADDGLIAVACACDEEKARARIAAAQSTGATDAA